MNKIAFIVVMLCVSHSVQAQPTMSCGIAQQQLQGYVGQVNYVANYEYTQGIPMRCGFNVQCQTWWFTQLNMWYSQQAQQVNNWYQQIAIQCTEDQNPKSITKITSKSSSINDDAIEDLEIDDEDKTVRIKIPSNPKGFNP